MADENEKSANANLYKMYIIYIIYIKAFAKIGCKSIRTFSK